MPKILQVVPRLPPYLDGVGDYALNIFKALSQLSDFSLEFLVIRPDQKSEDWVDGFRSYRLLKASRKDFIDLVPRDVDVILLQYSNYPYLLGKLDAPYWLLNALKP
ncbi:MAG: hypothetical protein HC812_14285 [Leptolyngbya sp. RL_3_1]|nr:hypothetical protein [Leptolyngbya sp. RL_3_1]